MVAVIVVDGARHCRFLNAVAEGLTGMSSAEARDRSLADLVWRDASVPFQASNLGKALDAGGNVEGEDLIWTTQGTSRPMAFRVVPLGPGAAADGAIVELIDLGGETGTARALRESEQRLRLAVEATGIGIWDVNAVTGERRWSPEMYAILGLPPGTTADQDIFSSIIHPAERDRINGMYSHAYASPEAAAFNAEFRIRRPNDGAERWIAVSGKVSFDAAGKALRGVGTLRDIHERRQFEEALLDNEKRLRVALAAGRMGTWRIDLATGGLQWDATQYRLFGVSPTEHPTWDMFLSLVHPDDRAGLAYDPDKLPAAGIFSDSEFRIITQEGETRWMTASSLVGYDDAGKAFEIIGINRDITAEKEAEAALRITEERNRMAIEANDVGTWDYDLITGEQRWSDLFKKLWGFPPAAPSDPELLKALVSIGDYQRMFESWRQATGSASNGRIQLEFQFRRADDGAVRWSAFTGRVFFDETSGKPVRAVGIMTDITERRAIEERQRLILREMNHRVKNSLALVQAIVSQTVRMTPDPRLAFERIQSRLMSLARTHDFFNQDNWAGVSLRTLIAGELEPFAGESDRVVLRGGQVMLDSSSMFALGLTFHELAANAITHGALSVAEGRVEIDWQVRGGEGPPTLEIVWQERGGPRPETPSRRGFGSRLIEANVRNTLGGEISIDYGEEGLVSTLSLPMRPLAIEDNFPEQVVGIGGRTAQSH